MNHPPTDLAVLYRRVSTDHQDGSLEVQEKRSLDYAAYKHLRLQEDLMFEDPDTSGSVPLLDRTGGRALLARLGFGDVKHLVVAKLDRLGRNTRDFLTTIETLDVLGVTLHIADFGGDSMSTQGHWGKMILTILAAVAEGELGEIRDRTRKRLRLKFDKGDLIGTVPFGFDCVYTFADGSTFVSARALSAEELAQRGKVISKRLVDNPGEQAAIRLMAELRAARWTLERIAAHLNTLGQKSKLGSVWQAGNVDRCLRSRHTARLLAHSALDSMAA
jgi:DNA invertase Pin-like site-specific DNA recombinase